MRRNTPLLALPPWAGVIAAIAAAATLLPIVGLASRATGDSMRTVWSSPAVIEALGLSARTATASMALAVVLGVPLGLSLGRLPHPVRPYVRALMLAPLVMPPVVSGLGLLFVFGRRGLLGESLSAAGVTIAFSTTAVVMAQTFVALPFVASAVDTASGPALLRRSRVAESLGASRTRVLLSVIFPALRPAIVTGAILAFARSTGEFGATLAFAGSREGTTRTASLLVYLLRESDPSAAVALGLVLVVFSVIVVGVALAISERAAR